MRYITSINTAREPKIDLDGTALAEAYMDGVMYEESDARYDLGGQFTTHDINALKRLSFNNLNVGCTGESR